MPRQPGTVALRCAARSTSTSAAAKKTMMEKAGPAEKEEHNDLQKAIGLALAFCIWGNPF